MHVVINPLVYFTHLKLRPIPSCHEILPVDGVPVFQADESKYGIRPNGLLVFRHSHGPSERSKGEESSQTFHSVQHSSLSFAPCTAMLNENRAVASGAMVAKTASRASACIKSGACSVG